MILLEPNTYTESQLSRFSSAASTGGVLEVDVTLLEPPSSLRPSLIPRSEIGQSRVVWEAREPIREAGKYVYIFGQNAHPGAAAMAELFQALRGAPSDLSRNVTEWIPFQFPQMSFDLRVEHGDPQPVGYGVAIYFYE